MMHRLEFHAMGSRMLAVVEAERCPPELQAVPSWFETWEQILSRFLPNSELSRLNQSRGREVALSPTLWEVYQAACEAERLTDGLVTAVILEALMRAGYEQSFECLPCDSPAFSLTPEPLSVRLGDLPAEASTRTLVLPPGTGLDFGGIAKGWAAQRAVERLRARGPALVDAGGDIAVSGPRVHGEPWPIGVADPFQPERHLEIIHLEAGGVATSGRDYRRWARGGIPQHHIIDPRYGRPAETDVLTATVIAPTVLEAEAMAKAILILGSRAGLAWLESLGAPAALLVLDNGERLYSRNFEAYL